jgi:hypothetical protein
MWLMTAPAGTGAKVYFQFSMGRAYSEAEKILSNFRGIIQSDAYSVYDKVSENRRATKVACWMHGRRNFFKIAKTTQKKGASHYILNKIGKLYQIEKELPKEASPEMRLQLRKEKSKPIVDEIYKWLLEKKDKALTKGPFAKAVAYMLNRWDEFLVFLSDGRVRLDTGMVENEVRPFAVGRRNWLFIGSERGGTVAAAYYTLIRNCEWSQVPPYDYFCWLFTEFPKIDKGDKEAISKLLPHHFAEIYTQPPE